MKESEIPQDTIYALFDILRDEADDRLQYDDYESPSEKTAHREVICPDGYVFVVHIIIPDGEQIDYEQAERVLDRHTEKSFRYLLSRGKAGLRGMV